MTTMMMLPSLFTRQIKLCSAQLPSSSTTKNLTQVRNKFTKTKRRRLEKKANPKPKNLPNNYIDPKTPVKISPTADRPSLAMPPTEDRLFHYLPHRSKALADEKPPLRFHFTNLKEEMSPKLQKLFHLSNASSSELAQAQKSKAMELFEMRPGDTGSSAVQVIALTNRIQQVQKHVTTHRKDYSGKRGLDALYVRRRKMLDYLERKDYESYKTVVNALGLVR
jgi:small subunit ribosomal protein S15